MPKQLKGLGAALLIAVNLWILPAPPIAAATAVSFEDCDVGDLACVCDQQGNCTGYILDNCDVDYDC